MKNKKRNYVVVGLVVLLLALAIGYAAFSDTLTISGVANVNGKFDMTFESAKIDEDTAVGINVEGSKAEVTGDNYLDIIVDKLSYPGAGTNVTAVVKNNGTVPATLNGIEWLDKNGNTFNDDTIEIEAVNGLTIGEVIEPQATATITFSVKWKTTKTEQTQKSVNFTAKLNYTQKVD